MFEEMGIAQRGARECWECCMADTKSGALMKGGRYGMFVCCLMEQVACRGLRVQTEYVRIPDTIWV